VCHKTRDKKEFPEIDGKRKMFWRETGDEMQGGHQPESVKYSGVLAGLGG